MRFFSLLFLVFIFLVAVSPAFALEWPNSPAGSTFEPTCDKKIDPPDCKQSDLTQMIKYLYEWAIALGGLAAFIMLLVAGFQYLTSTGDPTKTKDARDRIGSAIGGLVLLLASVLILNIINPELTTLRIPELTKTDEKKERQVDCAKDEDKDKPECKLPPSGSCAYVEIYPLANYGGKEKVTVVTVDRETGESIAKNLNIPLPKKDGSVKFFSYLTDETDETRQGGFCVINLYRTLGCLEDSLHNQIPFETSNLRAYPRAFDTACVKVLK